MSTINTPCIKFAYNISVVIVVDNTITSITTRSLLCRHTFLLINVIVIVIVIICRNEIHCGITEKTTRLEASLLIFDFLRQQGRRRRRNCIISITIRNRLLNIRTINNFIIKNVIIIIIIIIISSISCISITT